MLLYAITNRKLLAGDEAERCNRLVELAAVWAQGGVDYLQVREKDMPLNELQPLAARVVEAVRAAHQVYDRAGREAIVSVACHSPEEIREALGASMLLFSPIFEKVTEPRSLRGQGLGALRRAAELAAPIPVFALGGVTERNAAACVQAGAAGVAAIRLFLGGAWRGLTGAEPVTSASVRPSS